MKLLAQGLHADILHSSSFHLQPLSHSLSTKERECAFQQLSFFASLDSASPLSRRFSLQGRLCSTSSRPPFTSGFLLCSGAPSISTGSPGAALLPGVPPKDAAARVRAAAAKGEGKTTAVPKQGKKTAPQGAGPQKAGPHADAKVPSSKVPKALLSKGPKSPVSKGPKPPTAAEGEAAEGRERRRRRRINRQEQEQEQARRTAAAAPGDSRPRDSRPRGKAKSGSDFPPPGDAKAISSRNKAQLEAALRRFPSASGTPRQALSQARARSRGYQLQYWEDDSWSPPHVRSVRCRLRNQHQELRLPFPDAESPSSDRISFWAFGMDRATPQDAAEMLGTAAAAEAEARERQNLPTLERLGAVWSKSPEAAKFSAVLESLVAAMAPDEEDYRLRRDLVERIWECIKRSRHCSRGKLLAFGSFESDLFARWGDMDLCLLLGNPTSKDNKRRVLDSACNNLVPSGLIHSYPERVFHARVPLLIFTDRETNLSCDLSVGNAGGFIKSRVLRWFCSLDPRCRPLIFLVKCWAQAGGINSPKDGTLNSYAICLLVLFHLQTCSPPVLPPFSRVLAHAHDSDGAVPEEENAERREALLKGIQDRIEQIRKSGEYGDGTAAGTGPGRARNKSSLGALFASFFSKYALMSDLWRQGLAVRPFAGRWGDPSLPQHMDTKKNYTMIVEDPFDLRENCARSVHDNTISKIVSLFHKTAEDLRAPPQPKAVPGLRTSLFKWPPTSDVPDFVAEKMGSAAARRDNIRAQRQGSRLQGRLGPLNPGQPPRGRAPGRGPSRGQQGFWPQPQMSALPQQALAQVQHQQAQQWMLESQQPHLAGTLPQHPGLVPQHGSPALHQHFPPPGFPPLVHPQHTLGTPGMPPGMLPLGLVRPLLPPGPAVHHQAAALRGVHVLARDEPLAFPGGVPPQAYVGLAPPGHAMPAHPGQPPHDVQHQRQEAAQGKRTREGGRNGQGQGSWVPLGYARHPHGAPSPPSPTPPHPPPPAAPGTGPGPEPEREAESAPQLASAHPSASAGPRGGEASESAHSSLGPPETTNSASNSNSNGNSDRAQPGGVSQQQLGEWGQTPVATGQAQAHLGPLDRSGTENGEAATANGSTCGEGLHGTLPPSGASIHNGASGTASGMAPGVAPGVVSGSASEGGHGEEEGRGSGRGVSKLAKKKLQRKKVEDQRRAQTRDRKYEELVMEVNAPAPALPGSLAGGPGHTQHGPPQGLIQGHSQSVGAQGAQQSVGPNALRSSTVASHKGGGAYRGKAYVKKYEVVGPMVGGSPGGVVVGAAGKGAGAGGSVARAPAPEGVQSENLEQVTIQLASMLGVAKGGASQAASKEGPGSGTPGPTQEERVLDTKPQQALVTLLRATVVKL